MKGSPLFWKWMHALFSITFALNMLIVLAIVGQMLTDWSASVTSLKALAAVLGGALISGFFVWQLDKRES